MNTLLQHLLGRKAKARNTRRFKRFRISYLVKYQVSGKGEPRITNARDIGAGGLKFWTKEQIPASSLLQISIPEAPVRDEKVRVYLERLPALFDRPVVLPCVVESPSHVAVYDQRERIKLLGSFDLYDGFIVPPYHL